MSAMVRREVVWELHDNYQKQTYRNRCYICTDSGKHLLSIPIQHVGGTNGRQRYQAVHIDNSYPWQRQHWRTLETAYRTSPFFEYYEDDLYPLFHQKFDSLINFNLKTISFVYDALQLETPTAVTEAYEIAPKTYTDLRFLIGAKKEPQWAPEPYVQVFGDRHGFIPNTSTLDLLFNEGPNALSYLKAQHIPFLDA